MNSAKRYLAIAFTFILAVATFSILNPRVAHAVVSTLVQVTNTAANPVPTQAVGTTAVSGTVAIAPNSAVNVSSLPAVQLAGGSSVTLSDNSSDQPLFVRDVDNPGRQPFLADFHCSIAPGASGCFAGAFVIPPGKRAVMETVKIEGVAQTGDHIVAEIDTTTSNQSSFFFANNVVQGFIGSDRLGDTQQTRLYADPNSSILAGLSSQNPNSTGTVLTDRVEIVGYYVDVP